MLSKSAWLSERTAASVIGIPSTTNSGLLLELPNEPTPYKRIEAIDEGSPEELKICNPGTFPCSASTALLEGRLAISFPPI